jgi:hypothetical protein
MSSGRRLGNPARLVTETSTRTSKPFPSGCENFSQWMVMGPTISFHSNLLILRSPDNGSGGGAWGVEFEKWRFGAIKRMIRDGAARRQCSSTGSACRSMRGGGLVMIPFYGWLARFDGRVYYQLRGKVLPRQGSPAPACCWTDAAKYQLLNQNSKVRTFCMET